MSRLGSGVEGRPPSFRSRTHGTLHVMSTPGSVQLRNARWHRPALDPLRFDRTCRESLGEVPPAVVAAARDDAASRSGRSRAQGRARGRRLLRGEVFGPMVLVERADDTPTRAGTRCCPGHGASDRRSTKPNSAALSGALEPSAARTATTRRPASAARSAKPACVCQCSTHWRSSTWLTPPATTS